MNKIAKSLAVGLMTLCASTTFAGKSLDSQHYGQVQDYDTKWIKQFHDPTVKQFQAFIRDDPLDAFLAGVHTISPTVERVVVDGMVLRHLETIEALLKKIEQRKSNLLTARRK